MIELPWCCSSDNVQATALALGLFLLLLSSDFSTNARRTIRAEAAWIRHRGGGRVVLHSARTWGFRGVDGCEVYLETFVHFELNSFLV